MAPGPISPAELAPSLAAAGPLREPVATGLARADLLLSIGPEPAQRAFAETWKGSIALPHVTARLEPLQTGMDWQDLPALAFAGIGHPEKFFATLKSLGAELRECRALDDHQPFTPALLTRLETDAARLGAQLVTTEKDFQRLPENEHNSIRVLTITLQWADEASLDAFLRPLFDD